MRLLIHDYGGYAFLLGLSRRLAQRGHQVVHLYAAANPTPHGALVPSPTDPSGLRIKGVHIDRPLDKLSFGRRWSFERAYGRELTRLVVENRPDVVFSANTPIDSQAPLVLECERRSIAIFHWAQDLIGHAMGRLLQGKWGLVGRLIGKWYERREIDFMRRSTGIIVISEPFRSYLAAKGIAPERVQVVPNWPPLSELPPTGKDNAWSREHDLHRKFCFLYSGTLGLKHDPSLLLDLAIRFQDYDDVIVLVISQGPGALWLSEEAGALGLDCLKVLPFQPMEIYPAVLGAADVLVGILEPSASEYSVPSKVLSYLCASRPILLAMPADNPAAQIVKGAKAGLIVPPQDRSRFLTGAHKLFTSLDLRRELAEQGRRYAEQHFDEDQIASRIEDLARMHLSLEA